MVRTFSDLIGLWPNMRKLADDLNRELPDALTVTHEMVRKWKARDNIPPEYWGGLVRVAGRADIKDVTLDHLAGLASKAA